MREELRKFHMPIPRIDVIESQYEHVYWQWLPEYGGWTVLCVIFPNDPGPKVPCRHFESDKSWDALEKMARIYGFGNSGSN